METPITIHNFRNEVDESVLERGYIYFSNGWINAPKEVAPGHYESVIHEANPHAVSYSINEDGLISNVFCTCGDTVHRYCRHLAAVLFQKEKIYLDENRPTDWDRIEEESLAPFKRKDPFSR